MSALTPEMLAAMDRRARDGHTIKLTQAIALLDAYDAQAARLAAVEQEGTKRGAGVLGSHGCCSR